MFTSQCFDIQDLKLSDEVTAWLISDMYGEYGNDRWHMAYPNEWIDTIECRDDPEDIKEEEKEFVTNFLQALKDDGWDGNSSIMLKVWW